jgi:hypothetical protein
MPARVDRALLLQGIETTYAFAGLEGSTEKGGNVPSSEKIVQGRVAFQASF